MGQDRLGEIADEVYGASPEGFVAARDRHADAAAEAGETELAADVRRLRKPTRAAWAVNLLARQRGDLLDRLLTLGEELRAAQQELRGEALRRLNRQRHEVLSGLTRQARQLAADAGHPLSGDAVRQVEQTLTAALADPDAAAGVRSGRLDRALAGDSGFGAPPTRPAPRAGGAKPRSTATGARKAPASDRKRGGDELDRQRRGRIETELAEARQRLRDAEAEVERARSELAERDAEREEVRRRRTELVAELGELAEELAGIRDRRQESERRVRSAERTAGTARRRVDQLAGRLGQI
ncbi:hypothetical protein GCM10012275_29240 [Longimycelium tulufanense]|uniref:Uncharacterized protein n=1 Tax=Longimycelium tulufanense TaxID=907463 RepID=A0A8J3FU77_9PSEU|nr:hypothetical protein [Longimycelium tulufanense]GGM56304.1 hypothetical protein GCM10012275_29240 [Longimycelium tulufanense]